jgi:serine-type D-Ala-D-Ala carboxypeptidase
MHDWNFFSDVIVEPQLVGVDSARLQRVRSYLESTVSQGLVHGAVLLIGCRGGVILHDAVGLCQTTPTEQVMTRDTIFDLASLTKVVATWPATMRLVQDMEIDLADPISKYLDLNRNCGMSEITILQLLTHTSGLSSQTPLQRYGASKSEIIKGILRDARDASPGGTVSYSNRGFIILGAIVETVAGMSLDSYVRSKIWEPLDMRDTQFNPPAASVCRIAPTEYREELGRCQRGEVHDENAALLGGIAGHAGVFSTSADLASFCALTLANGQRQGRKILDSRLVDQSFRNWTSGLNQPMGLAWIPSEGLSAGRYIYGHLGFTGTAIWLSRERDLFVILLTNRVHPTRHEDLAIRDMRREIIKMSLGLVEENNATGELYPNGK